MRVMSVGPYTQKAVEQAIQLTEIIDVLVICETLNIAIKREVVIQPLKARIRVSNTRLIENKVPVYRLLAKMGCGIEPLERRFKIVAFIFRDIRIKCNG